MGYSFLVLCTVLATAVIAQNGRQNSARRTLQAIGTGTRAIAPLDGQAVVTVDFGVRQQHVRSVSGFVHGMDATLPIDAWITPLRPGLWRTGTFAQEIAPRAESFGARVTVVCSDIWGYDESKAPYNNYSSYEAAMRQIALQSGTRPIIFDLWNEPDGSEFWHGTAEQLLETFRRAHDAVRSVRPDALIAGPSMSYYDKEQLRTFLEYALQHDLRIDILTWHDFRAGAGAPLVEASLLEAREEFLDNPRYKPLGLREIHVNETINATVQFKPASVLGVFSRLERGGADAAARACWNESNGQSNCWNHTLEGLLTPGTMQPRAIWWAYKAYGDGVESRVEGSSSNGRTFVLASSAAEPGQRAQVLVGAYGVLNDSSPVPAVVELKNLSNVAYLRGSNALRVSITPIADTGEAAVPALPQPIERIVPIASDTARLELTLAPEAVYVIRLLPTGRARAVRH